MSDRHDDKVRIALEAALSYLSGGECTPQAERALREQIRQALWLLSAERCTQCRAILDTNGKCPNSWHHKNAAPQGSGAPVQSPARVAVASPAVAAPSHVAPINEEAYIRSILSVVQHDMREAVRRDLEALLDAVRATRSARGDTNG